MNRKPLGFGELCPKLNPVPEGASRMKFSRNGVNVHKGEDCHWFIWSGSCTDTILLLKGHDTNRILDYVDVYEYDVDGDCPKKIYSEFSKKETLEKLA